ncbi:MAG: transcription termination/antitermination protein NusA [Spirochaetes bacterium]|uniref:Transcription termination/antitermination protein NusA n=1 Tax=Candidatus Avitreponema avistercoris TaxID=2840705 RepID=A0A9D9ENA6_9SPIR|nr:transcription termination/antitermination protein NusA [Candidatus Avitreponema avistercoris]
MSSEMADAIRQLVQEKGIDEELVFKMIEDTLKAAYKRKFGRNDNAVVQFNEDHSDVSIYSKKTVVDGVYDPLIEIELEEALELDPECEVGDELLIEVNPKDFDRVSVQSGKQTAHQSVRDIQKDSLYSDFKEKEGEIIIGYYQRERNGNIYVDLGKTEGILPRKFQSPREKYEPNARIKAYVSEVRKTPSGLQIVLSRTDPEFVRRILELEIPEIYDKTVEIYKIVREPGYRTKVAVFSHRDDVDPVGACVGLKGVRIQAVINELEGEKIDVLRYDDDPRVFIRNALSPAEVEDVVILDTAKRSACAVVSDKQFSLAVGKEGRNVRLANRLVDWNIDVKTREDFEEMDIAAASRKAVDGLFSDEEPETEFPQEAVLSDGLAAVLSAAGIPGLAEAAAMDRGALFALDGMTDDLRGELGRLLDASPAPDAGETRGPAEPAVETIECPECGAEITIDAGAAVDMVTRPNCGVGLSVEYEDE